MPARVLAYLLLVVLGAAVGTVGAFMHAADADIGPLSLPLGLAVSIAAAAGLFVAGGVLTGTRGGTMAAAGTWLVAVGMFSLERPEGDLVVAADAAGYAFLLLGTLLAGVAVGLPAGTFDGRSRAG